MKLAKHTQAAVTVVEMTGELDSNTSRSVRDELTELAGTSKRLLLDMSGVTYMSSAGLRLMLLIYRQADATGCRIALTGVSPEIRAVMSATGFLQFFAMSESLDEGREVLKA